LTDDARPAGWYTDPFEPTRLRYWDADRWTEHVAQRTSAAAPADSSEPLPPSPQSVPLAGPAKADDLTGLDLPLDRGSRRRLMPLTLVVLMTALLAGGAAFFLLDRGEQDSSDAPVPTPRSVDLTATTPATTNDPTTSTTAATTTVVPPVAPSSTSATTSTTTSTTTTLAPECNDVPEALAPSGYTDIGAVSEEAAAAIRWARAVGLVSVGDGSFRPTDPMNRAEATTVMWRYFCQPTPVLSAEFTDVPAGVYFQVPVDWAAGEGIIGGTGGDVFGPALPLSRAQFVTMAWRAVGSPTGSPPSPFTDAVPGSFYSGALDWAFDVGLVNGRSPTTYAPDDPLDRLTAIVLFWRLETIVDPVVK